MVGGSGRSATRVQLSERFQEAIDAAAMKAGLHGTDGYLGEWRRAALACGDDLAVAVSAEAERIEQTMTDDDLARLARAGGRENA